MAGDLVIYGSYGYTGDLIAAEAVERGHDPVLAGRNRDRLTDQAIRLDCESEVVALDEPKVLDLLLDDADAVLNCAGPFSRTAAPMVEACLRTGTDYLDITGEIGVFESLAARDEAAADAGITLLPGVGFDVVPTDCLAAHLHDRLPEATDLALAFDAEGGLSPGTAKTAIEHLDEGGMVRRNGRLERVRVGHDARQIDFGWGRDDRHAVAIPWGDVSTAYHTTGIPNVTVYMSMPPSAARMQRLAGALSPVLGLGPVKRALTWLVDRRVQGPDDESLATGETLVWGEARTSNERVVSRLRCPQTYATTVHTALAATARVRDGDAESGFQTPAGAFGADFVLDATDATREDVA